MVLNAFSVDVEDYFQVSGFEQEIRRDDWASFESRVVENTRRLLRLLSRHDVRATFFVLGWVAEHYPDLVAEIAAAKHELASHSYWHRLVYDLSVEQFRDDLCRSRQALQQVVDQPIIGYRAPSFSITRKSLWALDVLAEEGFEFDSSVFPTRHPRYGIPGARQDIHQFETSAGRVWEFPPAVRKYGGLNLAVAGGGYFRLYPLRFTCHALTVINRTGQPFVFYVHPWEVDPQQPRLRAGSWAARFRHYVNLSRTERKLDHLLSRFRFGTVSEVIRRHAHEKAA
jgi:polysaccharide deacetylase family protein (PEP-CTERM system associated)